MSKYLEYFEGAFDASVVEKIKPENKPYVSYSLAEGKLAYTVIPKPAVSGPWVTFTALEDNSSIGLVKLSTNQKLEYSTDTTTWNTFDTDTTNSIPLNKSGDKVYIRGELSADNTESNYTQFKMSGKIAASGNCNALWNYQDLNAPLKAYCGYYIFSECTLTTAPELPATTLANWCYSYMFDDCTSLTTAPELPAAELAEGCYNYMFTGCTSLTTAPEILPAAELADGCYRRMFSWCTSLTTTPVLPATTLAYSCYREMFYGCTSLTTAPELPATELADYCYYYMFNGCSSLNHITCLATDISASYCTTSWLKGVSSTGTFVKHPNMNDWTRGKNGIPEGWEVVAAEL